MILSENLKTLLINIPDYKDSRPQESLGLNYLAAFIRKNGYYIDVLDANFYLKKLSYEQIIQFTIKNKYDIVGLPVYTPIFSTSIDIAKRIKEANSRIKIIFGGHHVTFSHKDILENFPFVDIIVRGEGEITLLELINKIKDKQALGEIKGITYRNEEKIIENSSMPLIEDLDTLPFPIRQRDYYDVQSEGEKTANLITSRGCPYRCSFCSVRYFYKSQPGKNYRMRSPSNVVDEIIGLVNNFKINHIAFLGDNIFINPEYLIEIADTLLSKGIFLTFSLIARADQVVQHQEYISILKQRGLRDIEIGIESGSQAVLNRFCKDITVEENRQAIDILKKNDIKIKVDFIMFDPQTSIEDLRKNIKLLKGFGIVPFFFDDFARIMLYSQLSLYPGTLYYEKMRKAGKLKGSIFTPRYEFENKEVANIYNFVRPFIGKLYNKIRNIRKSVNAAIFRIDSRLQIEDEPGLFIIKSDLVLLTFELHKILLKVIEKTLEVGSGADFSHNCLVKVKKDIKNELKLLKDKISKRIKRIKRCYP